MSPKTPWAILNRELLINAAIGHLRVSNRLKTWGFIIADFLFVSFNEILVYWTAFLVSKNHEATTQ